MPSPNGYISPNPSITYTTYDVETASATVVGGGGVPVFNDLGSGIVFGSVIATNADEGTDLLINLNAAALASINEFIGRDWVIGGAVTVGGGEVLEPSTYILLGSALAGLACLRRRART